MENKSNNSKENLPTASFLLLYDMISLIKTNVVWGGRVVYKTFCDSHVVVLEEERARNASQKMQEIGG